MSKSVRSCEILDSYETALKMSYLHKQDYKDLLNFPLYRVELSVFEFCRSVSSHKFLMNIEFLAPTGALGVKMLCICASVTLLK